LRSHYLPLDQPRDRQAMLKKVVDAMCDGKVVGWFQGRMEFGPRALGNRTLLVDPRDLGAKNHVNARLKRTEFMPFAPVCTLEKANDFFELPNEVQPFMYMTMTCNVRKQWRDSLPAITHVDGTARPQLVTHESNLNLYNILKLKMTENFPNTYVRNVIEYFQNKKLINTSSVFEKAAYDLSDMFPPLAPATYQRHLKKHK
jgi:predicted NodU family carbamoyl transferase